MNFFECANIGIAECDAGHAVTNGQDSPFAQRSCPQGELQDVANAYVRVGSSPTSMSAMVPHRTPQSRYFEY